MPGRGASALECATYDAAMSQPLCLRGLMRAGGLLAFTLHDVFLHPCLSNQADMPCFARATVVHILSLPRHSSC